MLKHTVKKVINIFEWLLTIVLVSVVLLLIFTAFDPVKSFRVLRVMSGSMEPALQVGSVVFVQKVNPETLKKGDIITFASADDPTISITHRLAAIEEKGGKTVFKTKGDANTIEDTAEISLSQIKGKVIFSLPYLGYLSVWIKQPLGFGFLVILPAILIIFSEIFNIKKSIEKEVEKKYEESEKQRQSKSMNSLLILCLLGISLIQIKTTHAYYSDVAVISGNTFSTGVWETPTPTSTPAPTPTISPTPTPTCPQNITIVNSGSSQTSSINIVNTGENIASDSGSITAGNATADSYVNSNVNNTTVTCSQ